MGLAALPFFEREAKARQKDHGGTAPGRETLRQKIAEVSAKPDAGKAIEQAAKAIGTNRQYITDAKKLKAAEDVGIDIESFNVKQFS